MGQTPAQLARLRFLPHAMKQTLPFTKEDQRGSHLPLTYAPSEAALGPVQAAQPGLGPPGRLLFSSLRAPGRTPVHSDADLVGPLPAVDTG